MSHNVTDLIQDHESLQRTLVPIRIREMNELDLGQIVSRAVHRLHRDGAPIRFTDEAVRLLASRRIAGGCPWFGHVIGQEALLRTVDRGRDVVDTHDIQLAVGGLARSRFSRHFGTSYRTAVGASRNREVLLRLLARSPQAEIPLQEAYELARKYGVTNPSTYKGQLIHSRYGAPIQETWNPGIVRFRNAIFRRYVCLRSSLIDEVRELLDEQDYEVQ